MMWCSAFSVAFRARVQLTFAAEPPRKKAARPDAAAEARPDTVVSGAASHPPPSGLAARPDLQSSMLGGGTNELVC